MDYLAVRQGLADAVDAIPKLKGYAFVPDSVTPPVFFVAEMDVDYDQTFGGMDDFNPVICRLLVARADDKYGQRELDSYLARTGPKSVKQAIESTRSASGALGGVCDDVHVKRARSYGLYEHQGTEFLGITFEIRVIG